MFGRLFNRVFRKSRNSSDGGQEDNQGGAAKVDSVNDGGNEMSLVSPLKDSSSGENEKSNLNNGNGCLDNANESGYNGNDSVFETEKIENAADQVVDLETKSEAATEKPSNEFLDNQEILNGNVPENKDAVQKLDVNQEEKKTLKIDQLEEEMKIDESEKPDFDSAGDTKIPNDVKVEVNGNQVGTKEESLEELISNTLASLSLPGGDEESKVVAANSSDEESDCCEESNSTGSNLELELPEVMEGDLVSRIIGEYRVKLFRFENNEWKERGVGKIKIMQSLTDPSNCNVTMWRDGSGLVACNFRLFKDFVITNFQSNPKILTWKCLDNGFGEEQWETFTCKFSNEAQCTDFKEKIIHYANAPPELPNVICELIKEAESESQENENGNDNALPDAIVEETEEMDKDGDGEKTNCPGCRGCPSSDFQMPTYNIVKTEEPLITYKLNDDDVTITVLPQVTPEMFD